MLDINSRGERKVDFPLISTYGLGAAGVATPSVGYVEARNYGIIPIFRHCCSLRRCR
jgi:hypothetical protein